MAKKKNKDKTPKSEAGMSARSAIVEDSASAILIPNLGQAVMVQAAPSRTTSNQQVVMLFDNFKIFNTIKRYKKDKNDNIKRLTHKQKFFITDKKRQIQPDRIIYMIMAIEVWTYPNMKTRLIKLIFQYSSC